MANTIKLGTYPLTLWGCSLLTLRGRPKSLAVPSTVFHEMASNLYSDLKQPAAKERRPLRGKEDRCGVAPPWQSQSNLFRFLHDRSSFPPVPSSAPCKSRTNHCKPGLGRPHPGRRREHQSFLSSVQEIQNLSLPAWNQGEALHAFPRYSIP